MPRDLHCHLRCGKVIPCEHFTFSAVKHIVQAVEQVEQVAEKVVEKVDQVEHVVTKILNDEEIKHEMQIVEDKHDKTLERLQALAKIMEELEKDDIMSIVK